ncbi:hypothetical protein [Clostridium sp. JN-9]|jgi:hypothetical protein|uniref:hypothetical protein n=1 Tax=Clostridium sp. JN-9 TaxID=2507159 RepID=UPI000FFE0291|nr:hypothetical protein [Clostridium sp. JN-9]QAT41020.1 hypothetical protein EQM05_12505 [Clostridium sp. JN-9]
MSINSVNGIYFIDGSCITDNELMNRVNAKITELKAQGKTIVSVSIGGTAPAIGAFIVIGTTV